MTDSKRDILQGTLDLMVLKTLETIGSLHGYGIAQRLQQVSDDKLYVNQGTLYQPCCGSSSEGGSRLRGASPRTTGGPGSTR